MTTRPKGITFPAYSYLTLSQVSGEGLRVTPTLNDYTVPSAWAYKPGAIAPINATVLTAVVPTDFIITGQNANAGLAATGGNIKHITGAGSVGNAAGNFVLDDTAAGGGAYNGAHYVIGTHHLWFDTSNRLRHKVGAPTTATDGNVVGFDFVGSAVYDPANLVDGAGVTTTVAVTGAALGDLAIVSFSLDLQGILLTAYVSAANVVSCRFQNETGGALDLGSGTLRVKVIKA